MKPRMDIATGRRQSGVTLIECLVYVAVLGILLGIGTAAFYFCWDHTQATICSADEIAAALRAGEGWRADVRAATGTILKTTTAAGETVAIPEKGREVFYRFAAGELRRDVSVQNHSRLLLANVKMSAMKTEMRANVTAWRWELEVTPRRKEAAVSLRFTFEAAPATP